MQQATRVHSDANPGTSSGNRNNLTRRAIFGLSAGAGLAVAVASSTRLSAATVAGTASKWDRVRARFESATRAVADYEQTYKPALKRITDAVGPIPPLSFDHTATSGQTARVEVTLEDADGSHPLLAYRAKAQEVAQARLAWSERNARYENEPAWVAIDARMTTLDNTEHHARKALMREPAPNTDALAYKLRLALDADELWDDEREALKADARRLA